jgi:hypothetical protein
LGHFFVDRIRKKSFNVLISLTDHEEEIEKWISGLAQCLMTVIPATPEAEAEIRRIATQNLPGQEVSENPFQQTSKA